jgi:hypothetical protein
MTVQSKGRKPAIRSALVCGLLLVTSASALADGSNDASAEVDRPLLAGTWKQQVNWSDCATGALIRPPFLSLNTYFRDRSHIEVGTGLTPALRTMGQGRWKRTGGRTFANRYELLGFDSAGNYTFYVVTERAIEVSADGRTLTTTGRFRRYTTDGVEVFSACIAETGERMPEPTVP